MGRYVSRSRYEVGAALCDSQADGQRPFSSSHLEHPMDALCEAVDLLCRHLTHEREATGITDEDLEVLRTISQKVHAVHEEDLALRRKQDLILRCLHPDGCYRGYLPKDVRLRAFEILGVDPVEGIAGVRLGFCYPELQAAYEHLAEHVGKLDWTQRR